MPYNSTIARESAISNTPDATNTPLPVLKPIQVGNWSNVPSVLAIPRRECRWVIQDFIAQGTLNMLSGLSGCGKSFVSLAIADAVSHGKPFAGLETMQLPVLYIDRENPLFLVQERMIEMGITDGEDFLYLGSWLKEKPGPQALDDEQLSIRYFVLTSNPPPLIIFDTAISFADGINENDPAQVRAFMNQFRKLVDAGATVLLLVHSSEKSKSAANYRGSSDYAASVDSAYHIKKIGKGQLIEKLRLTNFKTRFPCTDELVLRFDGKQFSHDATSDSVFVELLKRNPGIQLQRWEQITAAKGITRAEARRWLDEHVECGDVRLTKGGKNSSHYQWVGTQKRAGLRFLDSIKKAKIVPALAVVLVALSLLFPLHVQARRTEIDFHSQNCSANWSQQNQSKSLNLVSSPVRRMCCGGLANRCLIQFAASPVSIPASWRTRLIGGF